MKFDEIKYCNSWVTVTVPPQKTADQPEVGDRFWYLVNANPNLQIGGIGRFQRDGQWHPWKIVELDPPGRDGRSWICVEVTAETDPHSPPSTGADADGTEPPPAGQS